MPGNSSNLCLNALLLVESLPGHSSTVSLNAPNSSGTPSHVTGTPCACLAVFLGWSPGYWWYGCHVSLALSVAVSWVAAVSTSQSSATASIRHPSLRPSWCTAALAASRRARATRRRQRGAPPPAGGRNRLLVSSPAAAPVAGDATRRRHQLRQSRLLWRRGWWRLGPFWRAATSAVGGRRWRPRRWLWLWRRHLAPRRWNVRQGA